MTDDPDVRMAQSIVYYIFRRLALDHETLAQSAPTPTRSEPARRRRPTRFPA